MPVRNSSLVSVTSLTKLGIGISRNPDNSFHVGLLYRIDEPKYCHLAFHFQLLDVAASHFNGWWSESRLPPLRSHALAGGLAGIVAEAEKLRIPFSFDMRNCRFSPEGRFIDDGPGTGLTCATFILAYFKSMGVPLLSLETWVARPDDVLWQEKMLAILEARFPKEQAHIAAMRASIGVFRYRPEEVAAAVMSPIYDLPLSFAVAQPAGIRVISEMV